MMPVAARRFDSLPVGVSSIQSTSISRKCDSPLVSSYRLWIRIAVHSCICRQFPDLGLASLIFRIKPAPGNKIAPHLEYGEHLATGGRAALQGCRQSLTRLSALFGFS